jgi:5'-phosphate synthase pdxT subunit
MAKTVLNPHQQSLAIMDIAVNRNAYGRQINSFSAEVTPTAQWGNPNPFDAIFIRAPKIMEWGDSVTPLFTLGEEVVMVRQGTTIVSTFHPELTESDKLHSFFLELCGG